MAWESFSCKHYFILIPIFLQGALIFIQEVMRKRKIGGSYRLSQKWGPKWLI